MHKPDNTLMVNSSTNAKHHKINPLVMTVPVPPEPMFKDLRKANCGKYPGHFKGKSMDLCSPVRDGRDGYDRGASLDIDMGCGSKPPNGNLEKMVAGHNLISINGVTKEARPADGQRRVCKEIKKKEVDIDFPFDYYFEQGNNIMDPCCLMRDPNNFRLQRHYEYSNRYNEKNKAGSSDPHRRQKVLTIDSVVQKQPETALTNSALNEFAKGTGDPDNYNCNYYIGSGMPAPSGSVSPRR
jgi:hypothetical protein